MGTVSPATRRQALLEMTLGVGLLLIVYLWVEYADPNTAGMSCNCSRGLPANAARERRVSAMLTPYSAPKVHWSVWVAFFSRQPSRMRIDPVPRVSRFASRSRGI